MVVFKSAFLDAKRYFFNENQLVIGFGGRFIVYDLFLEAESGVPLTDNGVFANPSEELLMAVTSNDLTFDWPWIYRPRARIKY